MRNVTLIGMPGAGKSALGATLANEIGYYFIDMDRVIMETYRSTLKELIERYGAKDFVLREGKTIQSVHTNATVIATGGSAVYCSDAMDYLKSGGMVVYLRADTDVLRRRIGDMLTRGVVRQNDCRTLEELYAERVPLYEKYADCTVDVSNGSIETCTQKLCNTVREEMTRRGWRIPSLRKEG